MIIIRTALQKILQQSKQYSTYVSYLRGLRLTILVFSSHEDTPQKIYAGMQ